VAAALGLAIVVVVFVPVRASEAPRCAVVWHGDAALPDPGCTPGALNPNVTQASIRTTICVPGWTRTVRPSSSATRKLRAATLTAYHLPADARGELDHLVSLELGGAPADVRNLWVEPGPIPNPKDRIENALKRAVCDGRVTLAAVQRAIVDDWTTALARLGIE
jgi:hypothetical protein